MATDQAAIFRELLAILGKNDGKSINNEIAQRELNNLLQKPSVGEYYITKQLRLVIMCILC